MSHPPVLICTKDPLAELEDTAVWRADYARRIARTTREALARAAQERPRLIVVDSDLPGALGLIETLRREPASRGVSIAVVARGGLFAEEQRRFEAVANVVLLPPVGPHWGERLSQLATVPSRREIRVPVRVEFVGRGGGARVTGMAQNVSLSGMLVECVMPLQLGEPLRFSLTLPRVGQPVSGKGRVVRTQPPGPGRVSAYGVSFDGLSGGAAAALHAFVASASSASS